MEILTRFYFPLRNAHILFVVVTFLLFNLRFFLKLCWPQRPLVLFLRVVPHVNDTLLFASGIVLAWVGFYVPFTTAPWLGIKLILLVCYILLGMAAFKMQARTVGSGVSYILAMMCLFGMIWLAVAKPSLWE